MGLAGPTQADQGHENRREPDGGVEAGGQAREQRQLVADRLKAVKVSENGGKTHTPIRVMAMAATMLEVRPVSSQMIPREEGGGAEAGGSSGGLLAEMSVMGGARR